MAANKFGKCRLCPADGPTVRVYGSPNEKGEMLCAYHLSHPEDDQRKGRKKEPAPVKSAPTDFDEKLLSQFYREQWKRMPETCENCGERIFAATLGKAKFYVCHIVPKEHFKSVAVHPDNRWFGCWQCHHDYDSAWTQAVTMKVWPEVVERFRRFMNLIKDTELRHLPDPLRQLIPNTC